MLRHQPNHWKAIHRYKVGEVARAWVKNPRECANPAIKIRPVVLIRAVDPAASGWMVAGLTSQSHYKSTGGCRVPVLATARNGLFTDGYLWCDRSTYIAADDLFQPIGMVDQVLALTIIHAHRLGLQDSHALWNAAIDWEFDN